MCLPIVSQTLSKNGALKIATSFICTGQDNLTKLTMHHGYMVGNCPAASYSAGRRKAGSLRVGAYRILSDKFAREKDEVLDNRDELSVWRPEIPS